MAPATSLPRAMMATGLWAALFSACCTACCAGSPAPPFVKLSEDVFYAGTAQFQGTTPLEVASPPPPRPPPSPPSQRSAPPAGAPAPSPAEGPAPSPLMDGTLVGIPVPGPSQGGLLLAPTPAPAPTTLPPPEVKQLNLQQDGKQSVTVEGISMSAVRYSGVGPRYRNTNANIETPDVSLCVGNGYVVQPLNSAIAVYDYSGNIKAGIVALNEFFQVEPQLTRTANGTVVQAGDFFTDPSCVYDMETKRFFLSVAWLPGDKNALDRFGQTRVDPATNSKVGGALLVAVSAPEDPTQPWNYFLIPGSNDGVNSHSDSAPPLSYPEAPFIQDYPHIAVDSCGVYLTSNQFSAVGPDFLGPNIYVLSKSRLTWGPSNSSAIRYALPSTNARSSALYSYTLLPAYTAADGAYDTSNKGTMYFASLQQAEPIQGVGVWAITGTSSLGDQEPCIDLSFAEVLTPPVSPQVGSTGPGPGVPQKNGPIPIGKLLAANNTVSNLDAGSTSMYGCTWAQGKLWLTWSGAYSADNLTGVAVASISLQWPQSSASTSGNLAVPARGRRLLWQPPTFCAQLQSFSLFGVAGEHLIYPSIAVNSKGAGLLCFTLTGKDYYPTAAYTTIQADGTLCQDVFISGLGKAPLDDSDSYENPANKARYGDWQTAAVDEDGNGWAAMEYVSGLQSAPYGNWATQVIKVSL